MKGQDKEGHAPGHWPRKKENIMKESFGNVKLERRGRFAILNLAIKIRNETCEFVNAYPVQSRL